jgi:hypothetical protein
MSIPPFQIHWFGYSLSAPVIVIAALAEELIALFTTLATSLPPLNMIITSACGKWNTVMI